MAIINAVASGDYSNTATWTGGVIPGSGDIASSGGFRITLDVDPEAQLSTCNTDWVAAGGTALSTAHTGGFDVPNGATRNIPAGMRYGFYRAGSTASNQQNLYITNGTVTMGDLVYVEGNTSSSRGVYLVPTGTLSFTVGDIYTSNVASSSCAVELAANTTANVTTSLGEIKPVTGNVVLCEGFRTGSTAPNMFGLTVRKTPWTSTAWRPLSILFGTVPIGGSSVTFLEPITAKGTGTSYIGYIKSVGTVTIPSINLSSGSLVGIEVLVLLNVITSAIINGNVVTNGKSGITVSSLGTVIVNGNLVRASGSTNDSVNIIVAMAQIGDIIINGDIIENGSNRTSPYSISTAGIIRLKDSNLTCNNIIGIGRCAMVLTVESTTAGKTLTVLGNVDGRDVVVLSGVAASYVVYLENNVRALNIHIHGNVYGAISTSSTTVSDGTGTGFSAMRIASTSDLGSFIVDGRVVAGDYSPAIVLMSPTLLCEVEAGIVEGGDQVFASGQSCPAIVLPTQRVVVSEIICGLSGRYPVNGRVVFKDSVNGVFRARNESKDGLVFIQQVSSALPVAADIRYGTTVGAIVGTCHVPEAHEVLFNVPVDNTVGSLVPTVTTVDTSSLTVALAEIKSKTDQLVFNHVIPATHDAEFSNVACLINLKTAVAGTATFTDVQEHIFTRNGSSAGVVTSETHLGNPVISLTGHSFSATSADFAMGTSDFTVEFWFKPNANQGLYGGLVSTGSYSSGGWTIRRNGTSTDFMYTAAGGNGFVLGTLPPNIWAHIAIVRKNGVVKAYLNGTYTGSVIDTYNYVGRVLYLGRDTSFVCQGTLANLRISRISRYDAGFVVPVAEYPYIEGSGYYEVLASDGTSPIDYATRFDDLDSSVTTIKAKTDQLDFTANGVVTDSGTSATDYTGDLQQIKNLIVAGLN